MHISRRVRKITQGQGLNRRVILRKKYSRTEYNTSVDVIQPHECVETQVKRLATSSTPATEHRGRNTKVIQHTKGRSTSVRQIL